ncbi:hypothetical protein CYMTET_22680 [Cymbomonas tetramitiformis]|uniref:Uncharacterized protein n=1 Tax=Cymbomonas tetramitiformis TaxID=36881 RepID=A0AAE0G0V0_9CHLO|nr:hypothetical protein CYMTET_22680 [Cymbomonas tetramitiformis]
MKPGASHGLNLKAIIGSIKKVDAVVTDGQHGDIEDKKKADAPSPSKKIKKEVNAAERAKKPSYNNAPPPAQQPEGGAGNTKPNAGELRMTGGMSDEELAGILGLDMDRRAMELLLAVAEASTTRLPRNEESQDEQGALTAIPVARTC